jgi:hypothetical protein
LGWLTGRLGLLQVPRDRPGRFGGYGGRVILGVRRVRTQEQPQRHAPDPGQENDAENKPAEQQRPQKGGSLDHAHCREVELGDWR